MADTALTTIASQSLVPTDSGEHARFSPSGAERWMTCPGSVTLSEGMPESESEYADEGTRAHAFAERWLLMHFAQHGQSPFIGGPDEEMAKHVKVYVDECIRLGSAPTPGIKVFVESRVAMNEDVWGTADFRVWHPDTHTLYVRDLKYGAGVFVSVERNVQLRIYALAALITTKVPARTVNIGIVQPRYECPDGPVRCVDFDVADLLDLHADVADAVALAKQAKASHGSKGWDDTYLKPSEKGCRWCVASPMCPALKNKAQSLAKLVFSTEPTTSVSITTVGQVLPSAKPAYNPLELARTLDFLPILEAWIKNTREFAYTEAEKGIEIPDYKLVEKLAVRKFKEDTDRDLLAATLGVTVQDILKPAELLGVGDMEKLAPGKNAKERAAVLEPFVDKKSSGHTLVHNSDKRDPVRIDARAAFALPARVEELMK